MLNQRFLMLNTAALWIDEAHNLFCADKNLILRAVKSLMQGDSAVIVILCVTRRFGLCIEYSVMAGEQALPQGADHLDTYHFAAAWCLLEGDELA
jgi:hypothetical protein